MGRTSIREDIGDSEKRLIAKRVIAERFPDAVLQDIGNGDFAWMADSAIGHTTDIDFYRNPKPDLSDLIVTTYLSVEGLRVYAPVRTGYWRVWLKEIKEKHPEVYQTMVETAR